MLKNGDPKYDEEELKKFKEKNGITSDPNEGLVYEILKTLNEIVEKAEEKQKELKTNLGSLSEENKALLESNEAFINEMNGIKDTLTRLVKEQGNENDNKETNIKGIENEKTKLEGKIKDLEEQVSTSKEESSKARDNAVALTAGISSLFLILGAITNN